MRPFTEKQIELVSTFADQAVIAIENVRLFYEIQARTRDLTESLQFQTATSDVLKVISRSPDTLQPVLDVIVDTSRELCGCDATTIFLLRDEKFHVAAVSGALPAHLDHLKANPLPTRQPGFRDLARFSDASLLVLPDISTNLHRDLIVALASQYRLPAIYPFRVFVSNGGLAYYGTDSAEIFRRAVEYVDRILKGANPADLPVQAPTKFQLVINLRAAKAIDLTIPPLILTSADQVIEAHFRLWHETDMARCPT